MKKLFSWALILSFIFQSIPRTLRADESGIQEANDHEIYHLALTPEEVTRLSTLAEKAFQGKLDYYQGQADREQAYLDHLKKIEKRDAPFVRPETREDEEATQKRLAAFQAMMNKEMPPEFVENWTNHESHAGIGALLAAKIMAYTGTFFLLMGTGHLIAGQSYEAAAMGVSGGGMVIFAIALYGTDYILGGDKREINGLLKPHMDQTCENLGAEETYVNSWIGLDMKVNFIHLQPDTIQRGQIYLDGQPLTVEKAQELGFDKTPYVFTFSKEMKCSTGYFSRPVELQDLH